MLAYQLLLSCRSRSDRPGVLRRTRQGNGKRGASVMSTPTFKKRGCSVADGSRGEEVLVLAGPTGSGKRAELKGGGVKHRPHEEKKGGGGGRTVQEGRVGARASLAK